MVRGFRRVLAIGGRETSFFGFKEREKWVLFEWEEKDLYIPGKY